MAQPESPVIIDDRRRTAIVQPGNFIREWRKFRGMTQQQLGKLAGLSDGAISHVEIGRSSYTQNILEAIAPVLGCLPGDLLNINPQHPDPVTQMQSLVAKLKEFEQQGVSANEQT